MEDHGSEFTANQPRVPLRKRDYGVAGGSRLAKGTRGTGGTSPDHSPSPPLPGDSGSPAHAHGELGCRRLRNRNAEFAPDPRRRERRWIYIRGIRGNAEDGVKYAFRSSHPIRHELRSKSNRSRTLFESYPFKKCKIYPKTGMRCGRGKFRVQCGPLLPRRSQ